MKGQNKLCKRYSPFITINHCLLTFLIVISSFNYSHGFTIGFNKWWWDEMKPSESVPSVPSIFSDFGPELVTSENTWTHEDLTTANPTEVISYPTHNFYVTVIPVSNFTFEDITSADIPVRGPDDAPPKPEHNTFPLTIYVGVDRIPHIVDDHGINIDTLSETPEDDFTNSTDSPLLRTATIENYWPIANCSRCDFSCHSKRLCIKRHLVCDGINDCDDGSDELSCPDIASAMDPTLDCMNGECPRSYKREPGLCFCYLADKMCTYFKERTPLVLFSTFNDFYEAKLPEHRSIVQVNKTFYRNLNVIGAFDYGTSENDVFWLDTIENSIFRARANLNQNNFNEVNPRQLAVTSKHKIHGFVYDWMNCALIWLDDSGIMSVSVSDIFATHDYKQYRSLDSYDRGPGLITMDVERQCIFWINLGLLGHIGLSAAYIERIDIRGQPKAEKIVLEDIRRPVGLAVDTESTKVYWIDGSYRTLNSVGYDGSNRVTLYKGFPFIRKFISMDIFSNYLYFTNETKSTIQRININNAICKVDTLLSIPDGPPTWVKIVNPSEQRKRYILQKRQEAVQTLPPQPLDTEVQNAGNITFP